MDQKKTKSHLPGQYLDIALVSGQYLDIAQKQGQYPDIALAAGKYKIYCPALDFDLPTQSVTYIYTYNSVGCVAIYYMLLISAKI